MGPNCPGMSERMFGENVRRNCQDVWRGQITRRLSGEEMSEELSEGNVGPSCPGMPERMFGENARECQQECLEGGKLSGRIFSKIFSFN